ncbi:MAG: transporter [Desulfobulbaceae bacterium]|nr:transporter [Desulfobulbaceae bacterium]
MRRSACTCVAIFGLLFCGLFSFASQAAAGAWMRSEGESHYSATLDYSASTDYWDSDGVRRDAGHRFESWNLSQQYEYGYSYYRTLYAAADLIQKKGEAGSAAGLGDLRLGMRGRLNRNENGRTWEAGVIIPSGYARDRQVRLGYGRFGVEVGLAMRFLDRPRSHAETGVTVRLWEGPPAGQVRPYLKWTQQLTAKWEGWGELLGDFSLGNGKVESNTALGYDQLPEYDVLKAGLGVKYALPKDWSVGFGLYCDLWGRNVGSGVGGNVSVSRTWK